MKLRIAYYVGAFAISLAAFAGAYGYAAEAANTDARDAIFFIFYAGAAALLAAFAAVALAAFAGAYILSKKAA